jgi:hypothetical protein
MQRHHAPPPPRPIPNRALTVTTRTPPQRGVSHSASTSVHTSNPSAAALGMRTHGLRTGSTLCTSAGALLIAAPAFAPDAGGSTET